MGPHDWTRQLQHRSRRCRSRRSILPAPADTAACFSVCVMNLANCAPLGAATRWSASNVNGSVHLSGIETTRASGWRIRYTPQIRPFLALAVEDSRSGGESNWPSERKHQETNASSKPIVYVEKVGWQGQQRTRHRIAQASRLDLPLDRCNCSGREQCRVVTAMGCGGSGGDALVFLGKQLTESAAGPGWN